MLASKLVCPQCQAVMKSDRPVPPGVRVRCPRCATSFTTPGLPPASAAAPATGIVVARPAPLPAGLEAVPVETPRQRSWTIPIVVAVTVLLLLGGSAGVYFAFLRGGSASTDEDGPPVPIARPKVQPLIVLTPEEEKKVQDMTDRGVAFLKQVQNPQGYWDGSPPGAHRIGVTALAALTLLECGVKADDPAIQKAASFLRVQTPGNRATYELALAILFFNRLDDPSDKQRIQSLALNLVAGQTAQGGWTYTCPILNPQEQGKLLQVLRQLSAAGPSALARERDRWLAALPLQLKGLAVLQNTEGQPNTFFWGGGDNSNTQFALIGLWAARRHGLPLDPTLALVARRFERSQFPDGAWHYVGASDVSPTGAPTMTCAGLLGLAVGYGLSKDTGGRWGGKRTIRPVEDLAVKKALDVISRRVGEPRTDPLAPPPVMPETYFLWSVERVAVLWRLKTIGGKHWYQWGIDMLQDRQQPDGHWHAGVGHGACPVVDTSFALLFLQRANLVADLTEKLDDLAELPGSAVAARRE
jgi:hypothetical protein